MKTYNFDERIERRGSRSIKWEKPNMTNADTLYPLWIADMDFACSDAIIEALHKRVDERIYGYHLGYDSAYRKAVCSWFRRRFNWNIPPASIFYAGGVVSAIAYLIEILSEEGDGILIQTPVYHPFRMRIEAANRVVVNNPLLNTNGYYTMDVALLESQMKQEQVKGMILCSPHNPVGRVWHKEELQQVLEIAKRYHKWIIVDEIHCDIVREGIQHTPLLTIADAYANQVIACTAPSKSFNLAGLQSSNIIIQNVEYQQRWIQFVEQRLSIETANSFAITATKAAYNDSEEWLNQVNAYIDHNMKKAVAYLKEQLPYAEVMYPEGTYMLWVGLHKYGSDEKRIETSLLAAGVIFVKGSVFGEQGTCYVRINVACAYQLMMECLQVFVTCIQTL